MARLPFYHQRGGIAGQLLRRLEGGLEGAEELRGDGAVHDAVVGAAGAGGHLAAVDAVVDDAGLGRDAADAAAGHLAGVDDGRDGVHAEHADVAEGEASALVVVGAEALAARAGHEVGAGLGDLGQALALAVADHGDDEALVEGHGEADVHLAAKEQGAVGPGDVHLRHGVEGDGEGAQDEVVEGDLRAARGVELVAEGHEGGHVHFDGEVEVWRGLLAVGEALGDDAAHGAQGHRVCRRRGGRGQHVVLHDAAVGAAALEAGEVHAALGGHDAGRGRDAELVGLLGVGQDVGLDDAAAWP